MFRKIGAQNTGPAAGSGPGDDRAPMRISDLGIDFEGFCKALSEISTRKYAKVTECEDVPAFRGAAAQAQIALKSHFVKGAGVNATKQLKTMAALLVDIVVTAAANIIQRAFLRKCVLCFWDFCRHSS